MNSSTTPTSSVRARPLLGRLRLTFGPSSRPGTLSPLTPVALRKLWFIKGKRPTPRCWAAPTPERQWIPSLIPCQAREVFRCEDDRFSGSFLGGLKEEPNLILGICAIVLENHHFQELYSSVCVGKMALKGEHGSHVIYFMDFYGKTQLGQCNTAIV